MTSFEEGSLAFDFGAAWNNTSLHFDKHRDYEKVVHAVAGTKGVDFLGIYRGELYFIEVKDFRGYRIQNKKRLSTGELTIEVAQKVKDTVACIIGASRNTGTAESWEPYLRLLLDRSRPLRVILWLEQDTPPKKPRGRVDFDSGVIGKELRTRLHWLHARIAVHSVNEPAPTRLAMQVRNLPAHPTLR
jgi:hypothetical protein